MGLTLPVCTEEHRLEAPRNRNLFKDLPHTVRLFLLILKEIIHKSSGLCWTESKHSPFKGLLLSVASTEVLLHEGPVHKWKTASMLGNCLRSKLSGFLLSSPIYFTFSQYKTSCGPLKSTLIPTLTPFGDLFGHSPQVQEQIFPVI